jgi:5'-3' exoribonuclease 1
LLKALSSALDFQGVDEMEFSFELGEPFKPFQQLMGVLPEASKEHIPNAYQVCKV